MVTDSFSHSSPSRGSATFSGATADASPSAFDGLGIVVGLEAEARLARRLGVPVEVGGGGALGAAAATDRLIAAGVRRLLSFGLAGGLEPGLRPGAVIVPDVVISRHGHYPTDPPLSAMLGRVTGAVFSGNTIVTTRASKRRLHEQTGAACVDLESAAVAEAAARHAIPFAVLRVICDPAERSLPQAALVALDATGRIGLARVITTALGRPRELPDLIRLAADAAAARRALARRVANIRAAARNTPEDPTRKLSPFDSRRSGPDPLKPGA